MERSCFRYWSGSRPAPIGTWRSTRSIRCSTWPNGSCVPSHALCRGLQSCVCGTFSSARVSFKYKHKWNFNATQSPDEKLHTHWDTSICSGVKTIFRVGLVLLKCMLGSQEKLKMCPGQWETMERLRSIEPRYMQESFLIREVIKIGYTSFSLWYKTRHTSLFDIIKWALGILFYAPMLMPCSQGWWWHLNFI